MVLLHFAICFFFLERASVSLFIWLCRVGTIKNQSTATSNKNCILLQKSMFIMWLNDFNIVFQPSFQINNNWNHTTLFNDANLD